jgi:hypothetical protein
VRRVLLCSLSPLLLLLLFAHASLPNQRNPKTAATTTARPRCARTRSRSRMAARVSVACAWWCDYGSAARRASCVCVRSLLECSAHPRPPQNQITPKRCTETTRAGAFPTRRCAWAAAASPSAGAATRPATRAAAGRASAAARRTGYSLPEDTGGSLPGDRAARAPSNPRVWLFVVRTCHRLTSLTRRTAHSLTYSRARHATHSPLSSGKNDHSDAGKNGKGQSWLQKKLGKSNWNK